MKKLKTVITDTTLVLILTVVTSAILLICAADLRFKSAVELEKKYRWSTAGKKYEQAIRLNPLNTKYHAGYGDFLARQSDYHKESSAGLKKAESLYIKAATINPRHAEYALKTGKAQLAVSIWKKKDKTKIKGVMANFKKALKNDPNGFNISYSVGLMGMTAWKFLDDEDKDLVLDRLKYAIKIHPRYLSSIHSHAWRYTRDLDLLKRVTPYDELCLYQGEDRQKRLQLIETIKKDPQAKALAKNTVRQSDWKGISYYSNNVYKNGKMYWLGTMDAPVRILAEKATISVEAKGSPAYGMWPYMIVELDGEEIGSAFIESTEWKEYDFDIRTDKELMVLSVTFANDGRDSEKGEDRNIFIKNVRILGYETEGI